MSESLTGHTGCGSLRDNDHSLEPEDAEMETTYLKIGITIERENMPALVELLKQALRAAQGVDEAKERRLQVSRNAIFAGQKPPEDKGLLIDSRQAAKLLGISERTLWGMWNSR